MPRRSPRAGFLRGLGNSAKKRLEEFQPEQADDAGADGGEDRGMPWPVWEWQECFPFGTRKPFRNGVVDSVLSGMVMFFLHPFTNG